MPYSLLVAFFFGFGFSTESTHISSWVWPQRESVLQSRICILCLFARTPLAGRGDSKQNVLHSLSCISFHLHDHLWLGVDTANRNGYTLVAAFPFFA